MMSSSIPVLPPVHLPARATRLPTWRLNILVHRSCPVCREDQPELLCQRPDGLRVARCRACSMAYLPDLPAAEDLARFYADYAAFKEYQPHIRSAGNARREGRYDPFINILLRTGGLRGQRLLELGSSYGSWLQMARAAGADVSAVEIDGGARAFLERLKIPCSETLPPQGAYDILCAFDVLEHLEDPSSVIARIARCLKSGARILLAVPNGGDGETVGPGWIGYRVDLEHLNYFSARTLDLLLRTHGLFVEQHWQYMQPVLHAPFRDPFFTRITRHLLHLLGAEERHVHAPAFWSGAYGLAVLARRVSSP